MGMEGDKQHSIGNDWTWLGPMISNCVLMGGENMLDAAEIYIEI